MEQIEVVRNGGDPINTFRDPAKNRCIDLSLEDRGDRQRTIARAASAT